MTIPLQGAGDGDRQTPPTRATAILVTQQLAPSMTSVQECDARLAVCRGLAEYISGISYAAVGGRSVRFKQVHDEYAEPEEGAHYPAARIGLKGPAVYEARSLTPTLDPKCRLPLPDGRYMIVPCDMVVDLGVELWSTDVEERTSLIVAMELALLPNSFKYGFDLQLPYYFGARANYSLRDVSIEDDSEASMKRLRNATFTVQARVPLITLFSFPDAKPAFDLRALGDGPDVLVNIEIL